MIAIPGGRGQDTSLAAIRARAVAHEQELDVRVRYLSIRDLVDRWGISRSTIRAIAFDELRYLEFGQGPRLKRRRYHPRDVAAYEASHGVGGRAA